MRYKYMIYFKLHHPNTSTTNAIIRLARQKLGTHQTSNRSAHPKAVWLFSLNKLTIGARIKYDRMMDKAIHEHTKNPNIIITIATIFV
jgi:hypothetical protein